MTNNFYSAPSSMTGGYIVYGGYRRQRGAGLFGSFRNFMAPIGKQALSGVKAIARNKAVQDIAKKAAMKGAEVLTGVAVDALQGQNIGDSLKNRSRQAALETLTGQSSTPIHNRGRKRKAAKSKNRQVKRFKQKKRMGPAKTILNTPPAKKRRTSLSRAALNRKKLF